MKNYWVVELKTGPGLFGVRGYVFETRKAARMFADNSDVYGRPVKLKVVDVGRVKD